MPRDIALKEFKFLSWDDPTQLKTLLPLCLYLKHHNRGATTRSGTAGEVIGWVRAWLAESEFADGMELDATTHQVGRILATILEVRCIFVVWSAGETVSAFDIHFDGLSHPIPLCRDWL